VDVVSEAGDASGLQARLRAALIEVVSGSEEGIDLVTWSDRLPSWLLERFVPERNEPGGEGWTLLSWVYWFEPEGPREWAWWDAIELDPQRLRVFWVFEDWPYATEALRFLLEAAGADHISDWIALRS
jgi:hypothetical protein